MGSCLFTLILHLPFNLLLLNYKFKSDLSSFIFQYFLALFLRFPLILNISVIDTLLLGNSLLVLKMNHTLLFAHISNTSHFISGSVFSDFQG